MSDALISGYSTSRYQIKSYGREISAQCLACIVNDRAAIQLPSDSDQRRQLDLSDEQLSEIQNLLVSTIPEVAHGKVEIVKIRQIPTYKMMVVVRTADPRITAVGACIGPEQQYVKKLNAILREPVRFVSWSANLERYVKDCLGIRNNDDVVRMDFNPVSSECVVWVKSPQSAQEISGPRDLNLALASSVVEFNIAVEVDALSVIQQQITETIPEIRSGAIRIDNSAMSEGHVIMVLVSSQSIHDPAQLCTKYVTEIRGILGIREYLEFYELKSSIEETLRQAFPAKWRTHIVSVRTDTTAKTANIIVRSRETAKQMVGTDASNVRAIERLIDYRIKIDVQAPQVS